MMRRRSFLGLPLVAAIPAAVAPWPWLNEMKGGFKPGELVVLYGRPNPYGPKSFIHYHLLGTVSGRFSSASPNISNIPRCEDG